MINKNTRKRRFESIDGTQQNYPKKARLCSNDLVEFTFHSSRKIYFALETCLSIQFSAKTLTIIAEYAAFDSYEECIVCDNKFYYVDEDKRYQDWDRRDMILNKVSNNKWISNWNRKDPFYLHEIGTFCDECNLLCISCNKRFKYSTNNPSNHCIKCKQFICNNLKCKTDHYMKCCSDHHIYLSQIREYNDTLFQQNLFSIYSLLTTKSEYKSKIHTFDGYYPFNNNPNRKNLKRNKRIHELELKQHNKLNNLLKTSIGNILPNDITLLISQYGYGNIVQCHFCSKEHHIIFDPTPFSLLFMSSKIYKTVVLKQFKPNPIWFCKPLYFDDIKYPILQCTTFNQLIQCDICHNLYSLFINETNSYIDNQVCYQCISKNLDLEKCHYCDQYPLYPETYDKYHGSPALYCDAPNCSKKGPICLDCAIIARCCSYLYDEAIIRCKNCVSYCGDGLKGCDRIICYECDDYAFAECIGCRLIYCEYCRNDCSIINCYCGNEPFCKECYERHNETTKWKCNGCKVEYVFDALEYRDKTSVCNSFGDEIKLCDSCGENWICVKCNSFQRLDDNDKIYCDDCNGDEDTYIDGDVDMKEDEDDEFNDDHEYTTCNLFNRI